MEIITAHKTALLFGASGLVGSELLRVLLGHPAYAKVIAPGRRKSRREHPKLEAPVVNFDQLADWTGRFKANDVFIALGTTIKTAGSREAFRKVDFDYVLKAALVAKAGGASQLLLVSSAGANPESGNFYLRTKGQTETAIRELDYWATYLFRPGTLIGDREEFRLGEKIMIGFSKLMRAVKPDLLGDYSGTRAGDLARHMVDRAQRVEPGVFVVKAAELV